MWSAGQQESDIPLKVAPESFTKSSTIMDKLAKLGCLTSSYTEGWKRPKGNKFVLLFIKKAKQNQHILPPAIYFSVPPMILPTIHRKLNRSEAKKKPKTPNYHKQLLWIFCGEQTENYSAIYKEKEWHQATSALHESTDVFGCWTQTFRHKCCAHAESK